MLYDSKVTLSLYDFDIFLFMSQVDNMQQDLSIMNELVTGANQTRTESLASPPSRNIGGNCTSSRANFENGSSGLDDMSHSEAGFLDAIIKLELS